MFHKLTIDSVAARPVVVPMSRPLRTASGDVPAAPLVLVDVQTNEEIVARGPGLGLEWNEKAVARYAFQETGAVSCAASA
jgi:L-alanine-DL-glutamate epimerase-like enolase superfamily enzyme